MNTKPTVKEEIEVLDIVEVYDSDADLESDRFEPDNFDDFRDEPEDYSDWHAQYDE